MLLGLHVKNLALIEKAEVEFTGGLNILTGETGAGNPSSSDLWVWRWEERRRRT